MWLGYLSQDLPRQQWASHQRDTTGAERQAKKKVSHTQQPHPTPTLISTISLKLHHLVAIIRVNLCLVHTPSISRAPFVRWNLDSGCLPRARKHRRRCGRNDVRLRLSKNPSPDIAKRHLDLLPIIDLLVLSTRMATLLSRHR